MILGPCLKWIWRRAHVADHRRGRAPISSGRGSGMFRSRHHRRAIGRWVCVVAGPAIGGPAIGYAWFGPPLAWWPFGIGNGGWASGGSPLPPSAASTPTIAVPEPSSVAVLIVGIAATLLLRSLVR